MTIQWRSVKTDPPTLNEFRAHSEDRIFQIKVVFCVAKTAFVCLGKVDNLTEDGSLRWLEAIESGQLVRCKIKPTHWIHFEIPTGL
jgi:hypothetical protein